MNLARFSAKKKKFYVPHDLHREKHKFCVERLLYTQFYSSFYVLNTRHESKKRFGGSRTCDL